MQYKGIRLREFDLDAALARKPQLIVVDELAHTNGEGLRHAKRWQDVAELLDAGIDVYTTINVQHVESQNDVVAQVTGVAVRETVPDSIIERAHEIELIDTPPDELLQRLKEGRVYVEEQAARATQQFFRRESLVALRELALRETAARVGAQVLAQRAGRGDVRPWATADRILACIGPSPLSGRVIRTARRMAAAARSELIAASVETASQSERDAAQVRRNLQLADPTIVAGDITIDLHRQVVTKGGQEIHLTPLEYKLLTTLARHAGFVMTQRQLLREVWGSGHAEDSTYLRMFMRQLRQKLEVDPTQPRFLLTEIGVGYRFQTRI